MLWGGEDHLGSPTVLGTRAAIRERARKTAGKDLVAVGRVASGARRLTPTQPKAYLYRARVPGRQLAFGENNGWQHAEPRRLAVGRLALHLLARGPQNPKLEVML